VARLETIRPPHDYFSHPDHIDLEE